MLALNLKNWLLVSVAVVSLQGMASAAESSLTPSPDAIETQIDPSQTPHQAMKIEEGDVDPIPQTEPVKTTAKDSASVPGQTYMQPKAAEMPASGVVTANTASASKGLNEALRMAYMNNPTLRAARAEMRGTAERLPQAQSGWMPQSDVTGTITTADIDGAGTDDGTTSQNLEWSVTQPLYRGGRTVSGIGSAENLIMAQGAILNALEQQLLREVATAYMNVVRDKALVELSQSNIDVVKKQLGASKNRFEVGEVTRTDVAQSEARLARAQANYTAAVGNLKSSLATYEKLVGVPADGVTHQEVSFKFPATLDEAVNWGEKHNPSVVAAEYLHQSAEKDIGTVFGELLPELGLAASWDKTWDPQPGSQDDTSTKSLSLIATVPLYEGGYTRSRVRQAKYAANQRFIETIESKRSSREGVISSWESLQAANAEIESRKSQVEASRVAQEGVRQEAELGTRTILDALDSDQEYLDSQVALVSAERDKVVASFALAESLGILTPQTLGFPEIAYNPVRDMEAARWKMLGMDVDIVE